MRKARPVFQQETRRAGRTLAMVKDLPADGAVVVVHTAAMRAYLRRMIFDVRGADVLKNTRIMLLQTRMEIERLHTVSEPIFVDHAWFDAAADGRVAIQPGAVDALYAILERKDNARRP